MQKNRKVQRLDARKNRLKQWVVEIAMVDVCAHVNAPYSRQFARAIQFIDSTIREEHWKRQQSEQPRRIFHVRSAGRIVPCARQFVGHFFVAPMRHWPSERHRLHGSALRVHIRDPLLQIDEAIWKWSLEARVRLDV